VRVAVLLNERDASREQHVAEINRVLAIGESKALPQDEAESFHHCGLFQVASEDLLQATRHAHPGRRVLSEALRQQVQCCGGHRWILQLTQHLCHGLGNEKLDLCFHALLLGKIDEFDEKVLVGLKPQSLSGGRGHLGGLCLQGTETQHSTGCLRLQAPIPDIRVARELSKRRDDSTAYIFVV